MKREFRSYLRRHRGLGVWLIALACGAAFSQASYAQNSDWPTYHRTLEGGRYSLHPG